MAPLLSVTKLSVSFRTPQGLVNAVHDVSFTVSAGETLALVGESGCGKSVTSMAIMGLIAIPPGQIQSGSILYGGRDLLKTSAKEMNGIRGREISMVFQDAMTSLNPVYTVGNQLMEVIRHHQRLNPRQAREKAVEILDLVGIPSPQQRVDEYPFELSGGMRQRVMIAIALSCNPKVLIADEPTTALDVTIQAQIVRLLKRLQTQLGTAMIFISHDLGVVANLAHRVAVMYCGRIVEEAPVEDLYRQPAHPYTEGLLRAVPRADQDVETLLAIPGTVPRPTETITGCSFWPRCPYAVDVCKQEEPGITVSGRRSVRCYRPRAEMR